MLEIGSVVLVISRQICRGLTGLPLRLISKCSRGLRSGPSPMVAILLAFFYVLPFFDQQRRRVPVGTEVGVVMFQDNKLAISDQSTARIDDAPGRRSINGLPDFAIDQIRRCRCPALRQIRH